MNVSKQNVLSRLNEREQDLKLINERLALYDQEAKNTESLNNYKNTYFVDADQPFEAVVNAVKLIVSNNL